MVTEVNPIGFYDYNRINWKIFLAGTIDNGNSRDWQQDFFNSLKAKNYAEDIVVFNPRHPNGFSDDHNDLVYQINWELAKLEEANVIAMYIIGSSKSPISLMELGLWAGKMPDKLIVCCEPDFYRFENVRQV